MLKVKREEGKGKREEKNNIVNSWILYVNR